jgi:hypothetical protein
MTLQTAGLSLLLVGLILLWLALRRFGSRRPLSGMTVSLVSLTSLALGALAIGLSVSFHVLDQFTHEQGVGSIALREIGPRVYEATLLLEDETRPRHFRLAGDQWHLDVRFLKWQYPATLMGIQSLYQLDQLRGRYENPQVLNKLELTGYRLSKTPGLALWRLAKGAQRWLPWVDAVYGSSVYLPMADGARYRISVTTSGLIARAENEQAHQAVLDW